MAVYVDDMEAKYGRMIMCHMVADTTEELNAMADAIGVPPKWIQSKGAWKEHYDICKAKKQLAIEHGAMQVSRRELFNILKRKL